MPQPFPAIPAAGQVGSFLRLKAFRSGTSAQALGERFRAYLAAIALSDPGSVLRSVVATGCNAAPTFAVQAAVSTRPIPSDPGVETSLAEAEFRVCGDNEDEIDRTVYQCISAIVARNPGEDIDVREIVLAGAGDGTAWLVGVIAIRIPPPPP